MVVHPPIFLYATNKDNNDAAGSVMARSGSASGAGDVGVAKTI